MALYEVFSYSLRVRYKANLCSKTTLFYLLTEILTFILPVILIYSEGCLRSVTHFREQPDVAFKHEMLLLLETDDLNDPVFWSTYRKLNEFVSIKTQRSIPTVEHREEDYNHDGKHDELVMKIEFPLQKERIHSIKLLFMFDYKLHLNTKLQMECAAYIYHNSPLPGSSFYFVGDLNLLQREPLIYKGTETKYNISVISQDDKDASFLKLENIFLEYAKRNVSTILMNQYPVWKSGFIDNKSFTINLQIKYPEQVILFKVQLWELIKAYIIQYIVFFIVFFYIFYRIKLYIFRKQLVPTTVLSPIKRD